MSAIFTEQDIAHFVAQGFIRIDNVFSSELAAEVLNILWADIPLEYPGSGLWAEPVVRLGMYTQPCFVDSINTPTLHMAFDQLVGAGRWIPARSVGTFPVRFPSEKEPIDTGRHVDASFPGADPMDYFNWRINIKSKGRALLMLILYSEVSESDAPTIIYEKSHIDVAKVLEPEGDKGLSFMELAGKLESLPARKRVFATGSPGTVYLCHPFLVHEAQAHRGLTPKFMAQPPLLLTDGFTLTGSENDCAPVERAIRLALQ